MKICIDPGHGGLDPGAVGPGGTKEKDVTLAVAKRVASRLASACEVKLTRDADKRLGIDENADLAARVAVAEHHLADAFISIHCNAGPASARGVETYAYKPGGKGEQLAKAVQDELVKATGLVNRGVKFANYYVIRKTSMPAVLIELGFISNSTEERLLVSAEFQDKVAQAIAQGVAAVFGLKFSQPAGDRVKIVVAGKELEGLLINSTSYAPVRALAEALGRKVRWAGEEKTVYIE